MLRLSFFRYVIFSLNIWNNLLKHTKREGHQEGVKYFSKHCISVCVCVSPVSDQMDFSNISVYFKRRLKDPQRWWQSLDSFQLRHSFFFIIFPKHTQTDTRHTHFIILCCMAAGRLRLYSRVLTVLSFPSLFPPDTVVWVLTANRCLLLGSNCFLSTSSYQLQCVNREIK